MQLSNPLKTTLLHTQLPCLAAFALLAILTCADVLAESVPVQLTAAVFSDRLPGFNEALAREISGQVQAAGYATEFIGTSVLTNQALLTAKSYDLLVLAGARALPMAAAPAIKSYLQEGGDLLALGLPAWQAPLYQIKGEWVSRESYEAQVAAQRVQHIVEDFDHLDLKRWTRNAGEPSAKAEYELAGPDASVSARPIADLLSRQRRSADTTARFGMDGGGRFALDRDGGSDH